MGCLILCRQNWRNWKNKPVWFSDHFNRRRFNGKPDDIQERSRLPSHQIHRKRTPTRDLHDDRSLARSTSPKDNSSKQNEAPSTSSRDVTLKLKRNREDVDIAQYTVKKRLSGAADRSSEQPEIAVLGASPTTLTLSRRSINHTARVKMMKNESQRIFQCSYCPCSYMDRKDCIVIPFVFILKNVRTMQNRSLRLQKDRLFLIIHIEMTSLMWWSKMVVLQWIPFRSPMSLTIIVIIRLLLQRLQRGG
jgi:hypothetical protein